MLRRELFHTAAALACGSALDQPKTLTAAGLQALHPRMRVPLSFVIDDSTCLVNMGRFCMPQFAAAWPDRDIYDKPWRQWPHDIPDAFVREFAEFCEQHDVRGKYSIVPYPACVGWLDRELPGWSRRDLQDSLKLVRESIAPRFDIHPEMITHTRVIDLASGRPLPEINSATMENSFPQAPVSVDFMASYLAYALRILKHCELPCEGVTTPGGFANRVKQDFGLAVHEAVRDVYGSELPHYFKYVVDDLQTDARLEHVREPESDSPRVTLNVPAGTGDWFGGWDGDRECEGHRYCNEDASDGRMVRLISQNRPAVMLCHWPGLYNHGAKIGFRQFQQVVRSLQAAFGEQTQWMKLSEIGRYQAAKELTRVIGRTEASVVLRAPFACPQFTLQTPSARGPVRLRRNDEQQELQPVSRAVDLRPGRWLREADRAVLCFDLPRGVTEISW